MLEVGQKVWLSTRHLPLRQGTRKLSSKWTGPCLIKHKVAPEAWRVELPAGWKIHDVFHTSQLKPVVGEPRVPAPVLLDDAEDAEYEVKDIVGERSVRGRK